MTRVLFVCLGNICRSPTAEAVFRTRASATGLAAQADSAGTGDWHVGDPPYGPMQQAAREAGYEMSDLRARQVSAEDFHRFDLILAMDEKNLADLERIRPVGARARLALFLEHAPDLGRSVPDPYYTRDFTGVLGLIETATDALIHRLRAA
ncbi:low molecular weight phosphotyrosine protein phosphatase [Halovulum dunhuangense]|uniref:protein-tyrosine-phosphatase n=1 Tax=Halovulum dunhuangense TaxID=1505036 RepID=A0A849L111_9RHOB|nr:low molecular weight protein-tyrosine-phosphatase [Halovulum dunhuangense]NNU79951.1 low molecular weight phosphotyrosine protein phosphatase [Halovulum dunhuangense]